MKKIALLTLFTCLSLAGFSQVKLGLRVAPTISFNNVNSEGIYNDVDNSNASIRFSAGPIADFFFADNYAITTGLWYTVKRSAVNGFPTNGSNSLNRSTYNLQYLQIPVAVKLYTNEVAPDMRIYFILGGTFDIKLAEKQKEENNNFFYSQSRAQGRKAYKPIDAGILLGAGTELLMGEHTILFGGINYNRGLINTIGRIDGYDGSRINNDLNLRNSYLSLEIGIKF